MQEAGGLEIIHNLHSLLHLTLVVEVHFQMYTIASDIVEQRTQFVERHPTSHDALAASKNLLIQVIPFRTTALWLAHAWRPLDSVEFFNLQQGLQMMHRSNTVQMIKGIVNLLTLFTNKGLNEATIVIHADHR